MEAKEKEDFLEEVVTKLRAKGTQALKTGGKVHQGVITACSWHRNKKDQKSK